MRNQSFSLGFLWFFIPRERLGNLSQRIDCQTILKHSGCVIHLFVYTVSETILRHIGCVLNFSHTSVHVRTRQLRTEIFAYTDSQCILEHIGSQIFLGHIGCVIKFSHTSVAKPFLGNACCVFKRSHASTQFRTHRLRTQLLL